MPELIFDLHHWQYYLRIFHILRRVTAFITLLNMMLVSIVDCDKNLLALELVVDLSPMLDFIVEELSLLNPLQESWQVSSVESDFAAFVDDDFMQGLSKDNQIYWRIFIFCLWRSLWAWDFRASAAMFNFLSTFLKNVHLKLVPSDASANQSLYSSWSSHLFWKQVFYIFRQDSIHLRENTNQRNPCISACFTHRENRSWMVTNKTSV